MGVGFFCLFGWFFEVLVLTCLKNLYIQQKLPMVSENCEKKATLQQRFSSDLIRKSQKQTEVFLLELPTVSFWKQQG